MQIRPMRNFVVVKPNKAEEQIGRILIPEKAQMKPRMGKVLAVGLGRYDDSGRRIPMDVKKGDVVLYDKFSGSEVKEAGDVLVISEDHILGIVTEE